VGKPIHVLIVEDHRVLAEGLQAVLERDGDIRLIGLAGTVAEAARLAAEGHPDVVLMDYHLPDGTGTQAAATIRASQPNVAILMLTADSSEDVLLAAIEAGACGLFLKSQAADDVVRAVRQAADGEMLVPATVLASLVTRQSQRARREAERASMIGMLTPREREVLRLMAQGLDNKAIAADLVISLNTVRTYVQTVLEKLGVHSKLGAVARASEYGLLES
jgi:two-component system, NarL family, response regulator DevR